MGGEVVELVERREDLEGDALQATCANPRCDEQFLRPSGPGRRRDFHSEDCRRAAERDYRRLSARLDHYVRQADQMRARIAAYLRTSTDELVASGPTAIEVEYARDAIAEVRGMVRFLRQSDDEWAQQLVKLHDAVAPLVRSQPPE